jgi:hypothetical protein
MTNRKGRQAVDYGYQFEFHVWRWEIEKRIPTRDMLEQVAARLVPAKVEAAAPTNWLDELQSRSEFELKPLLQLIEKYPPRYPNKKLRTAYEEETETAVSYEWVKKWARKLRRARVRVGTYP